MDTDTTLVRIQTDPATGRAQAFFEKTVTVEGVSFKAPWQQVEWPLQSADLSVTIDGVTLTAAQISAYALALAYAARDQAAPPPTPPV